MSAAAPTRVPLGKAVTAGLRKALADDDKVILMGEDIGKLGGVFRITDGLQAEFGDKRVIDTPLAESGIIGTAVGLAFRGYRPVCEIQFDGFIYPAFDQIVSQVAKLHHRTAGAVTMPLTIRVPFGGGIGAVEHHSESPEGYFAATAGLRVVTCSNAADAYTMIQQAIASDDPVLFFEPKRRYWEKSDADFTALDAGDAYPLHQARIVHPGTDVTLLVYGPLVTTGLQAATIAAEEGRSIEVVDLRTISPLDMDTIADSVRRTGRLVIAHEAPVFMGVGAEIAARVSTECFYHLEAPIRRVGGFAIPYPPAKLEQHFLPDVDRILEAVDATFTD
ncbi:alpha-ketoacid dehydrogenase subunit beta [Gordonia hydrophobica]|uniref:Alpha-ketoacid dehydrogenase subunit beta n=1 Tax=Gordonia hydrophobica TaxID=40516 RepID=A0ABZ2U7A9_9ACTN|nr:alpha-ketoacid dehydrogenase subunit beta [Gordonia hydrophobica]MBM7368144.1 pyruvate dehydrogenase E1 component beta subunit [Gordonia hydrophobica]